MITTIIICTTVIIIVAIVCIFFYKNFTFTQECNNFIDELDDTINKCKILISDYINEEEIDNDNLNKVLHLLNSVKPYEW